MRMIDDALGKGTLGQSTQQRTLAVADDDQIGTESICAATICSEQVPSTTDHCGHTPFERCLIGSLRGR